MQATLGVDFHSKLVHVKPDPDRPPMPVKLSIFDTAGDEKYRAVASCHYRNARGTIIVYDVTNRESFENIERWLSDTRQLACEDCKILVLGNKTDIDKGGNTSF